jgi:hypothetical protein
MPESSSGVTREGLAGARPEREAVVTPGPGGPEAGRRRGGGQPGGGLGAGGQGGGGGRRGGGEVVPDATFVSYYGLPVLNKPTWEPLDIAGYLFLGGLAGSSSVLAAGAELTGRPGLARPLKLGAAGAIGLSLVALVHDLGRPSRFANMLRVLKPTSPMSVGSWILSAYAPAAMAAAAGELGLGIGPLTPARIRAVGRLGTLAAAASGPAVATYTAVLVADTAVPAWHGGHREMPFVFAGSAASAAAGLGLIAAPAAQSGPARRLGAAAAAVELGASRLMRSRMGLPAETYARGKAGKLIKAAEALTVAGAVGAVVGRRNRVARALAGACLMAGSALTRFGIFHAGVQSAEDPRYTIEPQRRRLEEPSP